MNSLMQEPMTQSDDVLQLTGLTPEQLAFYDDDALKYYWFLRVNKLLQIALPSAAVSALKQSGFFKNSALLHSLTYLQNKDLRSLRYDGSPVDLALHRILQLPECKTESSFFIGVNEPSDWFSIQCGPFSYSIPNYLWWLAPQVVDMLIDDAFLVDPVYYENIPIIKISTKDFIFEAPRPIVEFELANSADPVAAYVDSFTHLGIVSGQLSYIDKVLTWFPAIQLYELDSNWRYIFKSPIANKIVASYLPGDTFFDAVWRYLKCEINFVPEKSEHVRSNVVDVFGTKFDLLEYVLRPKYFIQKMRGE